MLIKIGKIIVFFSVFTLFESFPQIMEHKLSTASSDDWKSFGNDTGIYDFAYGRSASEVADFDGGPASPTSLTSTLSAPGKRFLKRFRSRHGMRLHSNSNSTDADIKEGKARI